MKGRVDTSQMERGGGIFQAKASSIRECADSKEAPHPGDSENNSEAGTENTGQ